MLRGPAAALVPDPRAALPAVTVIDGDETWTAKRDLLDCGPRERHFVGELEDDGRIALRFGDGRHGARPAPGARLELHYRLGGGTAGNVGAEAINHLVLCRDPEASDAGDPMPVAGVRNPLPAVGGTEPEPVEQVRQLAPLDLSAPGCGPSPPRTMRRWRRSCPACSGPPPRSAGPAACRRRMSPSTRWAAGIRPRSCSTRWRTRWRATAGSGTTWWWGPARSVPLDIALAVCAAPGHQHGQILAELYRLLGNRPLSGGRLGFFHPDALTFGEPVRLSRLVAAAAAVQGVESVRVTRLRRLFHEDPLDDTALEAGRAAARPAGDRALRQRPRPARDSAGCRSSSAEVPDDGSCGCGCGGHDERHAPNALYNTPGRTALDYRVGEYGSFLAAMLDRLASPAYPALRGLTVRTPDDPAIGLLDSWAVVGDLLTFHSERIADEGYLRTADEHRSLALLGRLVGHRPRPGIAADTHLAYTLDRDPRAEDVPVLIPRGARANSVPSTSDEESQAFETSEDLIGALGVERAGGAPAPARAAHPGRSAQAPGDLRLGTGTSLQTGDKLLFVFGGDKDTPGQRLLLPVARIRIDRDDEVTAIGLPQSAPASLTELVAGLREWITEDEREVEEGEPTPENPNPRPVSRIIEDFDAQVLAPLRADLAGIRTPAQFAARLVEPHDRLAEAQAIAAPYEEVAAWFEQLEAVVGELMERAADLEPSRPG